MKPASSTNRPRHTRLQWPNSRLWRPTRHNQHLQCSRHGKPASSTISGHATHDGSGPAAGRGDQHATASTCNAAGTASRPAAQTGHATHNSSGPAAGRGDQHATASRNAAGTASRPAAQPGHISARQAQRQQPSCRQPERQPTRHSQHQRRSRHNKAASSTTSVNERLFVLSTAQPAHRKAAWRGGPAGVPCARLAQLPGTTFAESVWQLYDLLAFSTALQL